MTGYTEVEISLLRDYYNGRKLRALESEYADLLWPTVHRFKTEAGENIIDRVRALLTPPR